MLGVGAKKTTYMDDVFSTNVYVGAGSGQVINNGIDNSTEGGMVWFKRRDGTYDHQIVDTIRGGNKGIRPNLNSAQITTTYISSFNNNGYTLGTESAASGSGDKFAAWNFRKAPGFFDVVTYTGTGSARTIAHSLGSVPGMILIKRLDSSGHWMVYHRSEGATRASYLSNNGGFFTDNDDFNSTEPTASVFSVGTDTYANADGGSYVAYLFAGGESTAATANSCAFSSSHLSIPDHVYSGDPDNNGNWTFWSNPFTIEMWIKSSQNVTSGNVALVGQWFNNNKSWEVSFSGANNSIDKWCFKYATDGAGSNTYRVEGARLDDDQWHHIAVVRDNSTIKTYTDGVLNSSHTHSNRSFHNSAGELRIGSNGFSHNYTGKISNLRIIRHVSQYTSPFKAPTAPLTDTGQSGSNVTGTVLLCCNSSTNTGSTFTSGTITANGTVTASSDSPFDDPAGFVFGENEDQNVIKCGSYVGNGSATGPEINLGWEPQWVIIKNTNAAVSWHMFDSMRGIITGSNDARLEADENGSEALNNADYLDLTPTGFKIKTSGGWVNTSGQTYIYIAIRRSDGYVGKPPELGTDVFNVALGNSNGSPVIPVFAANFPVDFALRRRKDAVDDWDASARLTQGKRLKTNTNDAESGSASADFDSNVGWNDGDFDNRYPSWMWKRHAGFDVVTYKGDEVAGRQIKHSLGKPPEMIWVKLRDVGYGWQVGHKGLNGGTNPWNYSIELNGTGSETSDSGAWSNTTPTSSVFSVGTTQTGNRDGAKLIAMLFASVDGISKVGYYDGSSSAQTITTGFQPRFLIVKCISHSGNWITIDTTNGWTGSNSDKFLMLNSTSANNTYKYATPTSTGFTVIQDNSNLEINGSGRKWIYYAHA